MKAKSKTINLPSGKTASVKVPSKVAVALALTKAKKESKITVSQSTLNEMIAQSIASAPAPLLQLSRNDIERIANAIGTKPVENVAMAYNDANDPGPANDYTPKRKESVDECKAAAKVSPIEAEQSLLTEEMGKLSQHIKILRNRLASILPQDEDAECGPESEDVTRLYDNSSIEVQMKVRMQRREVRSQTEIIQYLLRSIAV